ncbi:MAG: helix-turn-helix transcriptional regulator [Rhodocyclales bacterium]|nr:helix-turn-helix transcriptional regulator [Rhodocyclales bacterium]
MPARKGKALSNRERECLSLAARGLASKRIAAALGIREATVAYHLGNASRKLGATNRLEAVAIAFRRGLLGSDGA